MTPANVPTVVMCAVALGLLPPACGQDLVWQPRLDSFEYAVLKEAESKVLLNGPSPAASLAIVVTLTALKDIVFPKVNYTVAIIQGVPVLEEARLGTLNWDAFQLLLEGQRVSGFIGGTSSPESQPTWQFINALHAADEKVRGIYLLSSKEGYTVNKGKRLTVTLVSKMPKGPGPQGSPPTDFKFHFPGCDPVDLKFPSIALHREMNKR